jgi:GTPase SAR1 family protein
VSVSLSVAAHTNVGKTTLVRTLLKRDIGEVADRAHVTELAERHTLIDTPQGDVLYLWDTPGFGDSARLLKRLKRAATRSDGCRRRSGTGSSTARSSAASKRSATCATRATSFSTS